MPVSSFFSLCCAFTIHSETAFISNREVKIFSFICACEEMQIARRCERSGLNVQVSRGRFVYSNSDAFCNTMIVFHYLHYKVLLGCHDIILFTGKDDFNPSWHDNQKLLHHPVIRYVE